MGDPNSPEFLRDLKALAEKYGLVVGGGGSYKDGTLVVRFRRKQEQEARHE